MAKPLVVLDSNVIISSLLNSHSAPSQIIDLWRDYRFDLLLSSYILTEVKHTMTDKQLIHKYHISPIKQSRLLSQLVHSGKMIEFDHAPDTIVRDPKDTFIIQLALSGKANYLVTGDQDLLILAKQTKIQPLQILTPHDFLHELVSSDEIFEEYLKERERS